MSDVVQKEISFPIIPESLDDDVKDYLLRIEAIIREISLGATYLSALTLQEFSPDGAGFKDEDDMASDSAIAAPSQQSVKAFVDALETAMDAVVGHDGDGYALRDIDGTPTKAYTKYLTGNLNGDGDAVVAHGVTAAKILHVSVVAYDNTSSRYQADAQYRAESAASHILLVYDSTNISCSCGTAFANQVYRMKIDYYM